MDGATVDMATEDHAVLSRRMGALIRVLIAFCSCLALAGFLTLQLSNALAQERPSAAERVAVAEGRMEAARADIVRMEATIIDLQRTVSDSREKISDLNSKLSQVNGIGIGLASIMIVLQAAQMLIGVKGKR